MASSRCRIASHVALIASGIAIISQIANAQLSSVSGRVVRPGGDSVVAVPSAMVTLHRVAPDRAGPLDSVRTSAAGRFHFAYRRGEAGDGAIYFVSSMYAGVAYFTAPLSAGDVTGDDAIITVFDTTSRGVPMSIRGHHVIVASADSDGNHPVTEVYDVANDTSVTKVARGETLDGAAWSAALPRGARAPKVVDGDIPAAAVKFAGGRAGVFSPFAPGLKQLAMRYTLDADAFPLSVNVERPSGVLEVLVEDGGSRVTGGGLREVAPVVVDGRRFRRFLAGDVARGAAVEVALPRVAPTVKPWFAAILTLVIGGAMTLALAYALRRR